MLLVHPIGFELLCFHCHLFLEIFNFPFDFFSNLFVIQKYKWIRKLWYIYTMEYYSVIKKNAFESVLMRWMKLESIIQSEVSQKEKHQYSILIHIYMEFRKMVMMTLYVRQQKRHRYKEQTFGLCGRRRGWDDLREQH